MDSKKDLLNELFQFDSSSISISDLLINIIITALLAFLLGQLYMRYGNSLSNKNMLSGTFILVSLTTMIIIYIVKSSLALSLGLVGALSIIRFRTAIKEPEELAYFFICIAIGLGLGAEQRLITVVGVSAVFIFILLKKKRKIKEEKQNLLLTIQSITDDPKSFDYEKLVNVLDNFSSSVSLKRMDEADGVVEISLFVAFKNFKNMIEAKNALYEIDSKLKFSFLENRL